MPSPIDLIRCGWVDLTSSIPQEEITKAIAGRRCSLILTPTQESQMVELITKLLK